MRVGVPNFAVSPLKFAIKRKCITVINMKAIATCHSTKPNFSGSTTPSKDVAPVNCSPTTRYTTASARNSGGEERSDEQEVVR